MRLIHIRYKIEVRCEISLKIVNSAGVTVGLGTDTDSQYYRDYRVVLSVKVEPGNITEIMQPPTSLPLNRIFSTVTCMTRSQDLHYNRQYRSQIQNSPTSTPSDNPDMILMIGSCVCSTTHHRYCLSAYQHGCDNMATI